MKKLLTAALTAAALVLPAAVSYAAPAAKAASASHSGDAARQTDSRQSSAMNQTHTAVSKYSFDDTVRRLETAVKEKGMTVFAVIDHQAAARESHRFRHAQSRHAADEKRPRLRPATAVARPRYRSRRRSPSRIQRYARAGVGQQNRVRRSGKHTRQCGKAHP